MSSANRTARLANMMRREITVLLQREARDPRLSGVSVSDIRVSADLSSAKVYVRVVAGDAEEALRGLSAAQGFIRKKLSRSLRLRAIPKIYFKLDDLPEKVRRIEGLLHHQRKELSIDDDSVS